MESYETIGVAVRQHDAIRFSIVKGEPQTYFVAAEWVPLLFGRRTVPLYRLHLAEDFVIPEQVPTGSATISSTGRSVLLWLGQECLQIPTRQLQVHYERGLGETSKIIRKVEGAPSPSATAPAGACMAVA